ncbi:hypothetical protein N7463_002727 [Penicillium fimorum]|uniref:Uncharacterized protein n=1 Tax=Penicillium fimorum TaxID=1882269 RepID=A0A9W9Y0E0_9EURO|nr:hypothetical protein N7463_002727 [Penicillium fimorum]
MKTLCCACIGYLLLAAANHATTNNPIRKLPKRNRTSISLFLDLVRLALAYLHYLSYSSPLLRLTSS